MIPGVGRPLSPRRTVPAVFLTQEQGNAQFKGFTAYLAIAVAIALAFALYYLCNGYAFCFWDVGSDTFLQFYPLQIAVAHQLRALHSITWSFELALGGFLGTLFDPLWLLTSWFPDSWQLGLRLPMFFARVLLAGGFFYGYLRQVGFSPRLGAIGALCYAYSSYGMINAQWEILHGTEFVLFSAYLFLFERYLQTRSHWNAIAAGIAIGIGNPFGLYQFGLFTLLYAPLRCLAPGTLRVRESAGLIVRFGLWCLVGLALAAPLLLPAVYAFLESPRVSGNQSIVSQVLSKIFSVNDHIVLASEFGGLLGKDILGTGNLYKGWGNYFEGPGFYIGLLPLLCIPQLLGPTATRKERRTCVFALAVVAAYFVCPPLRFLVFAFGHAAFRTSTLGISALLLVLGLAGLRRMLISGPWIPGIVVAAIGILGIALGGFAIAPWIAPGAVNFHQVILVTAFALLDTAALLALTRTTISNKPLSTLLLVLVACELALFATPALIERKQVPLSGITGVGRYDDGTEKALALVRAREPNDRFYRVAKTYHSVFLDDPMAQSYAGTESYYFHNSSVTRFVNRMQIHRETNHSNYVSPPTGRPALLDLLDVKYELTRARSLDGRVDRQYIGSAGGVDAYLNNAAFGFGHFFDSLVSETDADRLPIADRDRLLLDTLVVEDPGALRQELTSATQEKSSITRADQVNLKMVSDTRFSGVLDASRSHVLMLAMSFDRGWHATLDGVRKEIFVVDYGLSGIIVPPGQHRLTLDYRPVGRVAGWWLAVMALALIMIVTIKQRRRRRQP
ncbi:MAG: YfhO family protein [Rhodanobacteraceae bacterium]